uniref:Uncharacterized protein n=1 Tax=Klebsiella pneumoniae TaxID=573 RepID=A0A8B0STC1_KLEPN|nr:hypothetical protein [Klebsiella pneumoniae]
MLMAGHALRWQGTGSDEVSTRDQKRENPLIFRNLAAS